MTETTGYDAEGYPKGLSPDALHHQRIYGRWEPFTVRQARDVFDPIGVPWWVVGGCALEAFTGVPRFHEDIDISMFCKDLGALRSALAGRFHVWSASSEGLAPLLEESRLLPDDSVQVWLREHALAPWRADVVLTPDRDGQWVFRRDESYSAALDAVTWWKDGVRYSRPEVVLAFKAKACRPKDEHDLEAALPLLDEGARGWLRGYLEKMLPGHMWLTRLDAAPMLGRP